MMAVVGRVLGREQELAELDAVVGATGAVLLRGEPGAGKSALLAQLAQTTQVRVLRAAGVETTSDIPYAAIAELLRPLRDELREDPGAGALRAALGLERATAGLSQLASEVAFEDPLTGQA